MDEDHQHNYRYINTICTVEIERHNSFWKRIDWFYCTVCLDVQTKTQTDDGIQPDWWFDTGD